ncbi:Sodium channel protein type 11 subunit alpha (NaN) (Sensory neuron sodium channel 2) (Sodium channel protein type XI subunit alpha) (Voltage-gated sodium channel subunit alpha Nav1.9) [Durusdinium trenchii]|uniref:Sodium channel protein type 11 subunit alpha (NaN) (Sensory neuron sodium channel 2) (Sodium channel protein type XI subunit alpha) (Voltage-gated sodium channel subunit alpha Nav1.9) n=1 Tax=Durusdinium trenchii TaxID=1381693 RepID=A0ABP0K908_9DINO
MVLDLECQGNQAGLDAGIIGLNVWSGFEPAINVMEHCFAVAFLLELCYRVYSERCKYFKEGMNIFDTVLVAVACIDLYILTPLLATSSFNNTSTLRLLRTVKLVRAVRIVRALRLFRGLRLLIKACSSFLPSLCWSMALLGLFMMMGALFMGNLPPGCQPLFGKGRVDDVSGFLPRDVPRRFPAQTFRAPGSSEIRRVDEVLEYVGHGFVIFYLLYITFVVFAVIRVISAIFLRETLEAANNDAEMLVQDRLHKKSTYVRKLEGIFAACDESGDGVLTENELTELMRDPRVQVYLESLEIDVRESTALFRLLQNSEGVICCDDFIDGILRCKGPARAIDQILLANDVKQVSEQVKKLTGLLNDAGVITGGAFTKKHVKRNLSDELALLPSMHATLSGRYILT